MKTLRLLLAALALVGCAPESPIDGSERAAEGANGSKPFGFHDIWDATLDPVGRGLSAAEIDQLAKLSAQAGANVNRMVLNWSAVESAPCVRPDGSIERHYDEGSLAHSEAVMQAHERYGIESLLLVGSAPSFAALPGWKPASCGTPPVVGALPPCPAGHPCAPGMSRDHGDDFAAFVAMLVTRFPRAVALELFNEPNSSIFWAPAPDPAAFTIAVRAAYEGRNSVGSKMPLVLGGLAMGAEIKSYDFLAAVYAHGGKPYFDGIGLHPYPNKPPWVESMWNRIREVIAVRNDHHDDSKKIWITEVGIGGDDALAPGLRDGIVRANREGEFVIDLYRSTQGKDSIAMFIAYSFRDWPSELGRHAVEGMLTYDLHKKPAYCQLARAFHKQADMCTHGLPRCDELGGAVCEISGNGACGGVGPHSFDCDHCCGGSL